MSVKVANSRFISFSLQKSGALYRQLISISDLHRLGKWLAAECEKAQMFRQTEKLKESSLILSGIPIEEYQLIGQFYQGFSGVSQNPRKVFEDIVEKSNTYKSKALIALAALELKDSNYDLGIKFCSEAIRESHNVSTIIHAARNIAVIKSAEGFHASALKDLEAIAPLIRYATPIARHQYLNSLAVEYGEIGRIEEASNISKIILASPYVVAYPEWRETGQDLALRGYKSRSSVRVIQSFPVNIVQMPEREPSHTPVIQDEDARVFILKEWKKKMVKEPNGDEFDNMTEKDLVIKIFQMAAEEGMTWKKLRKIIDYIDKVYSEPDE
jgi:tetratricopeptide (TPR) repeat protein